MNDNELIYKNLTEIIELLKQQQVVAYPTESIFGLGCDPDSYQAVKSLFNLKQRSWMKGLILVAANYQQLLPYIDDSQLTLQQKQCLNDSWPGPNTWVLPARQLVPKWLTGIHQSLAVRVSAHPPIYALCQAFGKPLVSTSANLSGEQPCKTIDEVRKQFGQNFPILEGTVGGRENPSIIRDIITGKILRQG